MFNYKLKSTPIIPGSDNYIKDYLERLGIRKFSSFLESPHQLDELNPFLLDRISEGAELLNKHITRDNPIFLVVDSDVDGYSSASIIYSYLRDIHPDVDLQYYIHPEKEHGVVPSEVPFGTALVIIPDAGSNQFNELQELEGRGVDVLILDHHLVDMSELYRSKNIVIVNNQISEKFSNKALSGAGVAYKFTQVYDKMYGFQYSQKYTDLAALGILSDMMLITDLDNNFIIKQGLNNIRNRMIKALLKKQSFSVTSTELPTITDIVFYITPVINGTIRMGTLADKATLFEAFVNNESTDTFVREWRGETIVEDLYEKVARECYNIKEKQNRVTEKTMERICEVIEREKLYENQVIIYKTSKADINDVQKSLTGLVAMKILQKYNRPTLILRPIQEDGVWYYRGSGRGKKAEGFLSFKEFLTDSGIVEYAQGHDMAFGTGVREDRIDELVAYANTKLSNVDFGTDTIEVDYIFTNSDFDSIMLEQFANQNAIYGNGIPRPTFAFELMLPASSFNIIGKNMDTIKIGYGGVNFMKFKSAEWSETVNYAKQQFPFIKATIIGRAELNVFNGRTSVQIIIEHMNLEELDTGDLL